VNLYFQVLEKIFSKNGRLQALSNIPLGDEELIQPGTASCPGCGALLALRLAMKVLGKNTILVNATGCMTVALMYGAIECPSVHVSFENAAAIAAGIDVALKRMNKRNHYNIVCFAGDGGTADIGFQSLSGAIERGHDFLYICYDNEAYMNTGGQKSGTTPWGATTSFTPYGKVWEKLQSPLYLRKEMAKIVVAHGVPFVATASIAYPLDYVKKINRALTFKGPTYIHVHCPCPVGWGFPENLTIKIARLAVETGIFPLYEVVNSKLKITVPFKRKPVMEYFKIQRRFSHLTEIEVEKIQKWIDERWKKLEEKVTHKEILW
jgi:pyruvate ferredoxin oxidoreductase beta subunit